MPMLGAIAGIASTAIGTGISAMSSLAAGKNAQQLGRYQQQQYDEEAKTSVALAQRKMEDQNLKTRLVQSTLQARAAGSGLSPSVGTPAVLAGQIASRGTYNSLMDLSRGQDVAAGYYNMGEAAKYQGDLANAMAPLQAAGSIAGGAGSMFSQAFKAFGGSYG